MELQYIVLTIIKILISVPAIVMVTVDAAALIGGHLDNGGNSSNGKANSTYDFKIDLSDVNTQEIGNSTEDVSYSEEIPDPSPLIVPGYNLPENIFNRGKPFYLEKDPLTGTIDFNSKSQSMKVYDDEYEYEEEEPESMYDKSNIDRKDGPISGSHKPSDINQLTPNFHDFLNLPVKYNPDKYVYPLISNSYANTKVQGNVNKHQNHKNYVVTTYKPTLSPTYYTTKHYFSQDKVIEFTTAAPTTTTSTTTQRTYPTTTHKDNLMKSPMNHPSFNEEFNTPLPTTTKRSMSIFEQLFGSDYDESTTEATERSTPPQLFQNVPSKKQTTEKNVLIGSQMAYDYTEEYKPKPTNKIIIEEYEYDYQDRTTTSLPTTTTTTATTSTTTTPTTTTSTTTTTTPLPKINISNNKVTSLPLGENHVSHNNRQPIIVATQNIREQLNHEKVNMNKYSVLHPQAPSTSNIHIAPDQDTVSFVVGNHQNVEGGGAYVGSTLKESPYDNNPFRPVYSLGDITEVQKFPAIAGSSVTIQPIRNSEASLSIGVPVNGLQVKPGQVVDEKLELDKDVEYPKGTGAKIVFPDEKATTYTPDLSPPPPPPNNREVLKLSSKPMFHQLPSDLTPPEKEPNLHQRPDRVRPPWDPRPGHFHSGRPEYARPPRPTEIYKRIDNLPNILPQFRPNVPHHHHQHHYPKNYARQPLLDRPSNRPIAFFEKLQPPPPPLKNLRKSDKAEDRIGGGEAVKMQNPFGFLQTPPKVVIANRRNGDDPETLQMIQAKQEKKDVKSTVKTNGITTKDNTDKPLYVVYPVNTPPLKLDVIDGNKKETVVIGTRAELPLPPSKIEGLNSPSKTDMNPPKEFNFELTERHDSPILKPHPRPNFPIKSDFPYPLERPDPSVLHPATPDVTENKLPDEPSFISSNQWNTIENPESRIITPKNPNQISVTLKTYTEKPIAVAYTPTESHDKFSMPNYASLVIPEIRPGNGDSEFTVSAVMHTHPQLEVKPPQIEVSKIEDKSSQEFQAPFQASANVDHSISQGWAVVRDKEDRVKDEPTTLPIATTSEFDIENFKPQLEGGFKPIYSYPDGEGKEMTVNERQE